MRRVLLLLAVLVCLAIAAGVGTALGIQWSGLARGATLSIDGDLIEGSGVAAVLGLVAGVAVVVACLVALVVLASLVIVVPLAIVFALGGVLFAVFVGLSPLLVPVLLVAGACVLLSRRSRRRLARTTPTPISG